MSDHAAPKRRYRKFSGPERAHFEVRFAQFASVTAVLDELALRFGTPKDATTRHALEHHWKKEAAKHRGRLVVKRYALADGTNVTATAISADHDPADEAKEAA